MMTSDKVVNFPVKRAYTLQEVHELTGLSLQYLRGREELKKTRFGRAIRVLEEDLSAFLKNGISPEKDNAA